MPATVVPHAPGISVPRYSVVGKYTSEPGSNFVGFDVRLMSSLQDKSQIPTEGKGLIIVAAVGNVLHFRIFDVDGKLVVDLDDAKLTAQARQIGDLRSQLVGLWPPHDLIESEKIRLSTAVTSIVGQSRFVQHVGLIQDEGLTIHGTEVPVWEMRPPLVAGLISAERTRQDARCPAHVVGWLSLSADERDGITDWLAEVDKQLRPITGWGLVEQYTVSLRSEDQWHRDEKQVSLYRRFSCVSFVLAAYLDGAGIDLVDTSNPESLPDVDLDTVTRAYGERLIRQGRVSAEVGLPGAGPWRILLAGYVCHAMNRPDESIRSVPYKVPGVAAADFPMSL
ncbi:MAG: hypothetical protein ACLQVF_43280 [Isosphaeraceae bacterium]